MKYQDATDFFFFFYRGKLQTGHPDEGQVQLWIVNTLGECVFVFWFFFLFL